MFLQTLYCENRLCFLCFMAAMASYLAAARLFYYWKLLHGDAGDLRRMKT